MHILIIALGSRGDVEPYIALAHGLQANGNTVRLLTHENFRSLVLAYGVDFWQVPGDVQDIAQSSAMRERIGGGNFLRILSQMAKEAEESAVQLAEAALQACAGMDLLVAGLGGVYVGMALTEKFGLPLVQAYYIPFTPTRQYASALFPALPPVLGGLLNRPSYQATRQLMWQGFRRADSAMRRQVLGLPRAPILGPRTTPGQYALPVLYCFSPAVIPPALDWDDKTHVTGYWFLDQPAGWSPSPELAAFLQAGPPPVYIGFGSMPDRDPAAATRMVLEAVSLAGQRAILGSGWGGLRKTDLPESVMMVDSVPFSWLFARVSAVVHHGGAGTTAWGLRAGVPSIIVPFFGDQPFWGRRVAALGVGPQPIPRKKLTSGRLAGALRVAVTDPSMRRRAAELGARIRGEDGVAAAVAVIGRIEARHT